MLHFQSEMATHRQLEQHVLPKCDCCWRASCFV